MDTLGFKIKCPDYQDVWVDLHNNNVDSIIHNHCSIQMILFLTTVLDSRIRKYADNNKQGGM